MGRCTRRPSGEVPAWLNQKLPARCAPVLGEEASADGNVGIANPVHAHADEVDAPAKLIGHGLVDVVTVRGERHGELRLAGRVLTQFGEPSVERGLASAEADSKSAVRI